MAEFAFDLGRRAAPDTHGWFCVETPGVFREYRLAWDNAHMTRQQRRQYAELLALAERHGTRISVSTYRRG